jgi:hypothetical protein
MLKHSEMDGRPCVIAYIDDEFEPIPEERATLIKVIFTDERGGNMFLNGPGLFLARP